jgi:hypothetical protein
MKFFKFKREISVGEILTFVSIVGSAISITVSWSYDRRIKLRENGVQIRREAANTLGGVKRAGEIYLSFYDNIQQDAIQLTELFAETNNNIASRDFLWKRLHLRQSEIQQRILNEHLETAYINLLPFDQGLDSLYNITFEKLRAAYENEFHLLLADLEKLMINYRSKTPLETAILGNELRKKIAYRKAEHSEFFLKGSLGL